MSLNIKGLCDQEIDYRKMNNMQNNFEDKYSKTVAKIITDNLFNLFNAICFSIAIALFLVGAYENLLFIFIVLINISVGITQEIIAMKMVQNLSLVSSNTCYVIRNQKEVQISIKEVVIDDILVLKSGDLICCDSVLIDGNLEVNESLLTGESDPVNKQVSSELLSGSYIISGIGYAKVVNVKENNYATKIAQQAKQYKKRHSELMSAVDKAIKFSIFFIIPISILLISKNYFIDQQSIYDTVVATSAAIIGMLPMGVILLITTSFVVGVIKLSKMRILVQDLYAIESLSRVNILCLDKTGTLTQGEMEIVKTIKLNPEYCETKLNEIMAIFTKHSIDNNATFRAIKNKFIEKTLVQVETVRPFNSEKKYSSITINSNLTYFLGAPEIIAPDMQFDSISNEINVGHRVIMLASNNTSILDSKIRPIYALVIADPLRDNAIETIEFFKKQGVQIKIISGDNPITVSEIAKKVRVQNADKILDLTNIDDETLRSLVNETTVFGRANPSQKKIIIEEYQKLKYTVAMTGDGVNDVMALRQSDCSIAMAQGSNAAKQVSQLVLVDSDFKALPVIINEGRRVVNNMIKVASIYFIKTFYSAFLTILVIFLAKTFPFAPIQVTLINSLLVGIPTFMLTFEHDYRPISNDFLFTTFKNSIPSACLIFLTALTLYNLPNQTTEYNTILYYVIAYLTILSVVKASIPLNKWKVLLVTSCVTIFISLLVLFKHIIRLAPLSVDSKQILFVVLLINSLILFIIERVINKKMSNK